MKAVYTTILAILLSAAPALCADFFPLQTGNTWTYRNAETGQMFTIRVSTPFVLNDQVYYAVNGYADRQVLVRAGLNDSLFAVDLETRTEVLLTSFEPFEGGWWDVRYRACTEGGQTLVKRATHDGPAGPIRDVQEIRYRNFSCADAGIASEQYAENIGLVRRTVNTIAGPRTFDLVYARVGHVVIEAAAHGRFTVSAIEAPEKALAVTLRIETDPAAPLSLAFSSGQEFDIVVKDRDGRVVYLWSSTALFIQATHEVTVSGEWAKTVAIPRPEAGRYTLEAWITTTSARLAATVPLVL